MADSVKKATTEEERQELAAKLDKDLEEFLNSRQQTPYTEGWNEATWQQVCVYSVRSVKWTILPKNCLIVYWVFLQEMEQHPFFMSKMPEEGEPLPPLLEAFQQLKYDPEENTKEGLNSIHKISFQITKGYSFYT